MLAHHVISSGRFVGVKRSRDVYVDFVFGRSSVARVFAAMTSIVWFSSPLERC